MWAECSVTPDTNANIEETETTRHSLTFIRTEKSTGSCKWIKAMRLFCAWNLAGKERFSYDTGVHAGAVLSSKYSCDL